MKLSMFTMPLHPPSRDFTEVLKEDRDAVILADHLGFEEAFIGEHITDKAEPITSSLIFISSLIESTKNIKLGSGTVNLPNNHPAAVAAQVAMLDNMLEGRFLFGISPSITGWALISSPNEHRLASSSSLLSSSLPQIGLPVN